MTTMREWLKSGKHLPPFMRDFGRAGWLFRWIDVRVQKRRNESEFKYLMDAVPNSVGAQIYVIDFFLWFMAMHGWTLQRSRQSMEFEDIEQVLTEFEKESREAFYSSLMPPKE